jgi:hypothetical protein
LILGVNEYGVLQLSYLGGQVPPDFTEDTLDMLPDQEKADEEMQVLQAKLDKLMHHGWWQLILFTASCLSLNIRMQRVQQMMLPTLSKPAWSFYVLPRMQSLETE